MFRKPSIHKLLSDELYQAEREVIGQEERVHRLKISLRQAEVTLEECEARRDSLVIQTNTHKEAA